MSVRDQLEAVHGKKSTRQEAELCGFIVDTCPYPWLAYKGDRFRPTETRQVYTDLEATLIKQLDKILKITESVK